MGNLKEELDRFNAINKYSEKLMFEQDAPKTPPTPPYPNAAPPTGDGSAPPDAGAPPDGGAPPADAAGAPLDGGAPPADAAGGGGGAPRSRQSSRGRYWSAAADNTEELDITDLVNMTKSIKKQLENTQNKDTGATQKMDDVFTKLNDLESKLGEMDNVIAKIDKLGVEVQQMKPKTPVEKLEMRIFGFISF